MKQRYIVITSTIFILACGSLPQTPSAGESTSPPSSSPPTQPPTVIPPTQANTDPNYFRDDFDSALAEGWAWLHEDASNWSLSTVPGALQINAGAGQVSDETITNLLLRPAPAGNFQFETKVTFSPKADYQFAGLIVYESPPNLIQAGRAFCDNPGLCVGDGLYVDYYNNGSFVTPNFAAAYTDGEAYLRLVRQNDTYTFQSSTNGNDWTLRGGTVSDMNPLQIGLVAGQNTAGVIPALFDYFEVRSLP